MGKVVRTLAPALLPGEKDTRPYWQRQRRTVQGWDNHRKAVSEWKRRNPEKNQAHVNAQRDRMQAKYGKRKLSTGLDFLRQAEEWNEGLSNAPNR